jgi:tripeptide aminopeptidase
VICKLGKGGNFVLLSHMDTARSTLNVNPVAHNDRITSDGNTILGVDNRAGVAAILFAFESSVLRKTPLNDFTIAFTIQEETTLAGSKNLGLDKNIRMGFIFDSHLRPGNFICESCGDAGFNLKIIGKSSHSGIAPEKGINSIKIACNAIAEIEFGRIGHDTTANIGIIKGGTAVNVVPELTQIEGEVRSGNLEKVVSKLDEIKNKFESNAFLHGGRIEFNYKWDFKPYKIENTSEVYKTIFHVLTKVGLEPKPNSSWGGSDANSLNEKGIESVNIGIGAENPHSNEEFILLDDLQKSSEIALELMKK